MKIYVDTLAGFYLQTGAHSRAHLHVDLELEGKLYLRDMLVRENSIPKEKHILFIRMSKIHHIFTDLICSVGLLFWVPKFRSELCMTLIRTQLNKSVCAVCNLWNDIYGHVGIQSPSLKPLPADCSTGLHMVCVLETLTWNLSAEGIGWLFENGSLGSIPPTHVSLLLRHFPLWKITLSPKWHLDTWVTKF